MFRSASSRRMPQWRFCALADRFRRGEKETVLTRHKGEFLKKCPGSDGQVCCNYFVINFASNCPMDCSYCYLQEYLADNSDAQGVQQRRRSDR